MSLANRPQASDGQTGPLQRAMGHGSWLMEPSLTPGNAAADYAPPSAATSQAALTGPDLIPDRGTHPRTRTVP